MAAPPFPALGSGVIAIPFILSGTSNASVADAVKFAVPFDCTLLYVTCCAQAKGGTQGTSTLTILNAGQAATNAMDLGTPAAKTVVEGTVVAAQSAVAANAALTADLVMTGGTTPTLGYITIVLWVQRRG